MPASPMTTNPRIKLIAALATLVPLAACLMIGFQAVNHMSAATDQAFEAVIQAAGGAEAGGNAKAVENVARKFQYELAAMAEQSRRLLLMIGTLSVVLVVTMSFILVRSLQSALHQASNTRSGPVE